MNGKSGFRLASILQTIDSENILVDEGWYNQDKHEYFLKNDKIFSKEIIGYIRFPRKAKLFTPKNNFITTFNYIEEDGVIGSTNILENVTTYNFNEKNFFTFRTRKNREIDLTEYYDLIYEYSNDCLAASIEYRKSFYKDVGISPDESLFFSIKLIPFGSVNSPNIN